MSNINMDHAGSLAANAKARLDETTVPTAVVETGGVGGDLLHEARGTIADIMRGHGGRNAKARLEAALAILDKGYLGNLTDEALLAEVKRRAGE